MKAPAGFKLSKSMRDKLPKDQRDGAEQYLWDKSGGLCALCDEPLPSDPKQIQPDHRIAEKEGSGGETTLENLYLAHTVCNRLKKNLPFNIAQPLIRFQIWAEQKQKVTFADFVEKFLDKRNQNIKFTRDGDTAILDGSGFRFLCTVRKDPATGTEYFFADVPVQNIKNDTDIQPRVLIPSHVWDLAKDFAKHPVHEPSNSRLQDVGKDSVELLQFDGQHKTTAQILLGRKSIPMKVYVRPNKDMIQDLIVEVQQGIKKIPLSTSDTLRKLGDVVQAKLEKYKPAAGKRTEKGYVASQPLEAQARAKKEFFANLYGLILDDPENGLASYVSIGKSKDQPLSDREIVQRLIQPLVEHSLLEDDIDSPDYRRDAERRNIAFVCNCIADELLAKKWQVGGEIDKRRASNFFYSGSINWWVGELILAIKFLFQATDTSPLLDNLSVKDKEGIRQIVKRLCSWEIWSTKDSNLIKAFRSNTVKNITGALSDDDKKKFSWYSLVQPPRSNKKGKSKS